ncbi:2-aminoethylphosphonate--pyruvate transaminase [Cupriavidus taiwanensis]|uniref:2-aminoethylphosphonate--pyruvate transaminase n=1 Tax=Cupriavidus taiwanensis TaxID=164546 RepID=UPI000E106B9B|nr:2-aminoethylphosphonate--pyruvate transaminase [Cupriavidus taiwanensis]SOY66599.1 2-aminoethylphosphonate--pyruvate transaminase 2 [Cupriavidus taiwanensis]SOY66677.1 2-aminoethylphosphonate--pyruvate transaminase 2 [Cupriavidus taiwanensis]SOY94706.1 2-aminoethylphosphonate--pyruvate transaminase 2 [Cupriavidus taiwanensis]SOZ71476.1 2-aminoethylphosphonate--pyruvate transaminase 2 [Cupriavidus taiwanensis]SOZ86495.1 2-aminoethylphosphonate--pyruvate transaminase 2 [Cupriavidus taiwanensi
MTAAPYPILLTPGPLTTSDRTRAAMLRDWGSWDTDFNAITARIREQVLAIVHGTGTHECVPLQGSGTFSVEAAIGTLVPRDGHVLVPVNGAYCQRIARICKTIGRRLSTIEYAEDRPMRASDIDRLLAADPSITHVAVVHCETGTGVLNPLDEIAQVVARHGRGLIVDAMSSFGAIDIDARTTPFDAVIAASGKCLEGVPGMGFVIARRTALERCEGNSPSLSLDLYDQWKYMERTTQWRFTPPTHVVAALDQALQQYVEEGGLPARGARYTRNCALLVAGMEALGLKPYLERKVQAPIIVTFHAPADPRYDFKTFYQAVKQRGYILYPGKLTEIDTFRVGCIGHFGDAGIPGAVKAIGEVLAGMGVEIGASVAA